MNKQQSGFTLIELVVVIVILGILAATALPRFVDLGGSAREASRNAYVGSLNSAIQMVRAQWLAQGSQGTVTPESGTAITLNANGYPDIGTTYNDAATCTTLIGNLLGNVNGLTAGFAGGNCTVTGDFGAAITIAPTAAS